MNRYAQPNNKSQVKPVPQHGRTPMAPVSPPKGSQQGSKRTPLHSHVSKANELMNDGLPRGDRGEP